EQRVKQCLTCRMISTREDRCTALPIPFPPPPSGSTAIVTATVKEMIAEYGRTELLNGVQCAACKMKRKFVIRNEIPFILDGGDQSDPCFPPFRPLPALWMLQCSQRFGF